MSWQAHVKARPDGCVTHYALERMNTVEVDLLKLLTVGVSLEKEQRRWLEQRCNGTGLAILAGWEISYRKWMHPYWVRRSSEGGIFEIWAFSKTGVEAIFPDDHVLIIQADEPSPIRAGNPVQLSVGLSGVRSRVILSHRGLVLQLMGETGTIIAERYWTWGSVGGQEDG